MIKLDVEPYCHECPDFEPVKEGPETTVFRSEPNDGMSKIIEMNDTVVRCKYQSRCRTISDYLYRRNCM